MEATTTFRTGYCDLCIPSSVGKGLLSSIFADAARLGYRVVALDHRVTKLAPSCKPTKLPADTHGLSVLQRLTLVSASTSSASTIGQAVRQGFDVIAAETDDEATFSMLCRTGDVHLITFDPSSRLPFRLRGALVLAARARGIGFELQYGAAIRDASALRFFVANLAELNRVCQGRNVVLSSGARHRLELRAPPDAMSLATMAGLSRQAAKATVLAAPTAVCRTALSTRITEGVCLLVEGGRPSRAEALSRQLAAVRSAAPAAEAHGGGGERALGAAADGQTEGGRGAAQDGPVPASKRARAGDGEGEPAGKRSRPPSVAAAGAGGAAAASRSKKKKKASKKKASKKAAGVSVAAAVEPGMQLR